MDKLECYTAMKKECVSAAYSNMLDLANLWLNKKKAPDSLLSKISAIVGIYDQKGTFGDFWVLAVLYFLTSMVAT